MARSAPPSRREILTGRLPEAHISSLVVHARPEKIPQIRSALLALPGVEIHAAEGGKLVITLETASEAEIVTRLHEISLLEGVLSAALVYHHYEPEA